MENCLGKIERLLQERCGVSFEKKSQLFRMNLLKAMEQMGIYECEEVVGLLADEENFQRFLSYFMVSQSYFFREAKQFDILRTIIEEESPIAPSILSIPCANGEEPYSLAISLLDSGVYDFSITAYDINPQAIKKAREGCYAHRDVSQVPHELLEKYFEKCDAGWKVKEWVKEKICFEVRNLFELYEGNYDFIFCRNLMIYLSVEKREEAMRRFYHLLKSGGYLFLSFSDYVRDVEGFDKISLENIYKKRV